MKTYGHGIGKKRTFVKSAVITPRSSSQQLMDTELKKQIWTNGMPIAALFKVPN